MTDEQKRFKIQKKESYEEQIKKENKTAIQAMVAMGISAALALCAFSRGNQYSDLINQYSLYFAGGYATITSTLGLTCLIISISKKTMLEGKLEDINIELEMPEDEESRGMRK